MRKKLAAFVVLNIMAISWAALPAAAAYTQTLDIYEYLVGPGTISWAHTYDHSADPICSATLCIVADDVDGPDDDLPTDGEQDEVWVNGHYLGLLNDMGYYTNWNYYPGPGNPDQPTTETCFNLDPTWINGLPVDVIVEADWGVEIETSTLTVTKCAPVPLFSDILGVLSLGILAGVMVIRRRRRTIN